MLKSCTHLEDFSDKSPSAVAFEHRHGDLGLGVWVKYTSGNVSLGVRIIRSPLLHASTLLTIKYNTYNHTRLVGEMLLRRIHLSQEAADKILESERNKPRGERTGACKRNVRFSFMCGYIHTRSGSHTQHIILYLV